MDEKDAVAQELNELLNEMEVRVEKAAVKEKKNAEQVNDSKENTEELKKKSAELLEKHEAKTAELKEKVKAFEKRKVRMQGLASKMKKKVKSKNASFKES